MSTMMHEQQQQHQTTMPMTPPKSPSPLTSTSSRMASQCLCILHKFKARHMIRVCAMYGVFSIAYTCYYISQVGEPLPMPPIFQAPLDFDSAPDAMTRFVRAVTTHEPQKRSKNSKTHTWRAKTPWDAPPDGFYDEDATGSFQNCRESFTAVHDRSDSFDDPTPDDGTMTISCHHIFYRAPREAIRQAGDLIVGVLSAASGSGPNRRNYIRSTWASKDYFRGAFFLVAGPWEDIKDEFMFYRDMIWIDEEEVYQGEQSVLTYKTISFFGIVHEWANSVEDGGFKYAIKTDDDSYVNIANVRTKLNESDVGPNQQKLHYFGQCPQFQVLPSRDKENKWPVTYQTYPEPKLPLYCQGAGFGLSRELIAEAVEKDHIANFRYMPFEDVSIGILVERSGFKPTMIAGVHVFRADTPKERDCVNHSVPMTECYKDDLDNWPPDAKIAHKLIQHRVADRKDMLNIHKSLGLEVNWVKVMP